MQGHKTQSRCMIILQEGHVQVMSALGRKVERHKSK